MSLRRFVVPLTTDASGDVTAYTPKIYGRLVSIRYVKTDFDNGITFAVTAETTTETLWSEAAVNASATRYPRAATHSTAGAAALYAGGGTAVNDMIGIGGDRIKVVVSAGGNAKSGTLHITVDG